MFLRICSLILFLLFACFSVEVAAQESDTARLEAQIASLTKLVKTLSTRVEQLENEKSFEREIAAVPVQPAPVHSQTPSNAGG